MNNNLVQLEEHYGSPILDSDGRSICGRGRVNENGKFSCRLDAGWGTDHFGYGACKHHDTEDRLELSVDKGRVLYSVVTKNSTLREHLVNEEERLELDNLDGEIVLLRALMKILVEKYGQKVVDGETMDIIELGSNFNDVSSQTKELVNLVDKISAGVKRKYEVLQIAGSTVTRERVREYMAQVQLALGQVLRNECSHCHELHNQRELALNSIKRVGEL